MDGKLKMSASLEPLLKDTLAILVSKVLRLCAPTSIMHSVRQGIPMCPTGHQAQGPARCQ